MVFTTLISIVVVFTIAHIVLIKRDFLDPRLYVLYGFFHWTLISQIIYYANDGVWVDFELWERSFNDDVNIVALTFQFAYVAFFIAGYQLIKSKNQNLTKAEWSGWNTNFVFWGSAALIVLGTFTNFAIEFDLLGLSVIPSTYYLPISGLAVIGTLSNISVLANSNLGRVKKLFSIALILMSFLTSNTKVLFYIISLAYWFLFDGKKTGATIPYSRIIAIAIAIPVAAVGQLYVKEVSRFNDVNTLPYSIDRLFSPITYNEVEKRILELDSFNVEDYGVHLEIVDRHVLSDDLLYGRSLLVIFPILKMIDNQIRGAGRILVLEMRGSEWEEVNWALGVPINTELLMNFGVYSIFLYFAYGCICAYWYRNFKRSSSPLYSVIYCTLLAMLLLQQRGDILFSTTYTLYYIIGIYILFFWARPR